MNPLTRLAAAAIVLALAIGGSLYVIGRTGNVGAQPTASPTALPSRSALPAAPTASPSTGACSLVTSKEVETLAGNLGLGAQPYGTGTGNVTTCSYSDGGGNLVLRVTYTKAGGGTEFDLVQSSPGVQVVTEIGDAAAFDPDADTLYVLKGDALLEIFASAVFQDQARRLRMESDIGRVAADRM